MKSEKTLAVLGNSAKKETVDELKHLGFEVFVLTEFNRLPSPVSSHADMLMFAIDNKVFLSKDYAPLCNCLLQVLKKNKYDIVLCDCDIRNEYPFDVRFNIAKIGKNIFANEKHMSSEVKSYIGISPYLLHHVKQGYTKCSTVIVSDNAIITADSGIAKKARELKIDTLTISNSPKAVSLDGYNYGFLGGACGLFENTLYFCGNISLHPEYREILDFCTSHKVTLTSLSDDPLQDVGGILFF